MDAAKQQWSVEETTCLPAICSTDEVQAKLEGTTRTKPVFHDIQKKMTAAGYERTLEQINNKLADQSPVFTALNSATAMLDDTQSEPELSTIGDQDQDLMSPFCSSPVPSSSSGHWQQTRPAKRKRDRNRELLDYLERADERFLQHSKEMSEAFLHRMKADNDALLSIMGRMVSLMEAQAKK